MKIFDLENGKKLFDLNGELLVLLPAEMAGGKETFSAVLCGSWKEKTTAKGRRLVEILPGDAYRATLYSGSGDRTWSAWGEFLEVAETSRMGKEGSVFTFAVVNSRGGGCWLEFIVAPANCWKPFPYGEGLFYDRPDLNKLGLSEDVF